LGAGIGASSVFSGRCPGAAVGFSVGFSIHIAGVGAFFGRFEAVRA